MDPFQSFHELTYMETSCQLLTLRHEITNLRVQRRQIELKLQGQMKEIDEKLQQKSKQEAQLSAKNLRFLRIIQRTKGADNYSPKKHGIVPPKGTIPAGSSCTVEVQPLSPTAPATQNQTTSADSTCNAEVQSPSPTVPTAENQIISADPNSTSSLMSNIEHVGLLPTDTSSTAEVQHPSEQNSHMIATLASDTSNEHQMQCNIVQGDIFDPACEGHEQTYEDITDAELLKAIELPMVENNDTTDIPSGTNAKQMTSIATGSLCMPVHQEHPIPLPITLGSIHSATVTTEQCTDHDTDNHMSKVHMLTHQQVYVEDAHNTELLNNTRSTNAEHDKKIHIADTPLSDIQTQEEIIPPICKMDICAMQRDNNITHDTGMLDDDVFHAPEITNSQHPGSPIKPDNYADGSETFDGNLPYVTSAQDAELSIKADNKADESDTSSDNLLDESAN